MLEEPKLVKPSEFPRLFCPHCGCVGNDITMNIENFTIEEAWRTMNRSLYFSKDYPNVTGVEFHTKGFCKHCGVRFDMILEHMQPNNNKKQKKKKNKRK